MESAWEKSHDVYSDNEVKGCNKECKVYELQREWWPRVAELLEDAEEELILPTKSLREMETVTEEHEGVALTACRYKMCRGRPVYALQVENKSEACKADHVRQEHTLTFQLPMLAPKPINRLCLHPYHWLITDTLPTLHLLLASSSDLLVFQGLCWLKEWSDRDFTRRVVTQHGLIETLTAVLLSSNNCALVRMAASLLTLLSSDSAVPHYLVTENFQQHLQQLLEVISGYKKLADSESKTLLGQAVARMVRNDFCLVAEIVKHFKLSCLFQALNEAHNTQLKMSLLSILTRLTQHPEAVRKCVDIRLEGTVRASLSLVPRYHEAGFRLLHSLLRASRANNFHPAFLREGYLTSLLALLQQVFDVDPNVVLNLLRIFEDLADGEEGPNILVSSALNILTSIVYFKNNKLVDKRKPSSRPPSRKKDNSMVQNIAGGAKGMKSPLMIHDSISNTFQDSKQIDKYNSSDSKAYDGTSLPLDFRFLENQSELLKKEVEEKSGESGDRMLRKWSRNQSFLNKASKHLKICDLRLARADLMGNPSLMESATMYIRPIDASASKVDNLVRLQALQLLSILATRRSSKKLIVTLSRSTQGAVQRYGREKSSIAECGGECLEMLLSAASWLNPEASERIMKQLMTALDEQTELRAKAAIHGAMVALVRRKPCIIQSIVWLPLRKLCLPWMKEEIPPTLLHKTLFLLYCACRHVLSRDFVISKAILASLVTIMQTEKCEEECRLYAICCTALLTLANRRLRRYEEDCLPDTMDSFQDLPFSKDFFAQLSENLHSPLNFFSFFLFLLIIKRSGPIYTNILLTNLTEILMWTRNFRTEKTHLGNWLENTTTLAFHKMNRLDIRKRIDEVIVFVCVDEDKHGTFPGVLQEDVCPIYTVYSLNGELTPSLPCHYYDFYERYKPLTWSPSCGSPLKSVFVDSVFGLGGDGGLVRNFSKRAGPSLQSYLNYDTLHPRWLQLPSLHHYISFLTDLDPITKIPPITSLTNISIKDLLIKLNLLYNIPVTNFTKYQLQLIAEASENNLNISQNDVLETCLLREKERTEKNEQFRRFRSYFPGCLLEEVANTIFYDSWNQKQSFNSTYNKDISREAADLILSTMLATYERLNNNKLFMFSGSSSEQMSNNKPVELSKSGRKSRAYSIRKSMYEMGRKTMGRSTLGVGKGANSKGNLLLSLDHEWTLNLGYFGKAFMSCFNKPYSDLLAGNLISYFLEESDTSKRRRKSSVKRSKAGLASSASDLKEDEERKSIDERDLSKRKETDLYLPTKVELLVDFFTQARDVELRIPHFPPNPPFLPQIISFNLHKAQNTLSQQNQQISRQIYNTLTKSFLNFIKTIKYDSFNKSLSPNGIELVQEKRRNFSTFCDSVKCQVWKALERQKRRRCWYKEMLRIIGESVCKRLEGPYSNVSHYILRHHRKQIKRLMGSSVIGMGLLRVGGGLERAILFKLFADQFLLPCELVRYSSTQAWVRVPKHPFKLHSPLCIVDLQHSPGKLRDIISPYVETTHHNPSHSQSVFSFQFDIHSQINDVIFHTDTIEDDIVAYLKKKNTLRVSSGGEEEDNGKIFSSGIYFHSNVEVEEETKSWRSDCSSPMSDEYSRKESEIEGMSSYIRERSDECVERDAEERKREARRMLSKYCWREEEDRYCLLTDEECGNMTTRAQLLESLQSWKIDSNNMISTLPKEQHCSQHEYTRWLQLITTLSDQQHSSHLYNK